MPETALALLKAYGIPVAQAFVALTPDEAVVHAEKTGFPVVMKIRSRTIVHKTDIGGIMVNLRDADEVRAAFNAIRSRLEEAGKPSFVQPVFMTDDGCLPSDIDTDKGVHAVAKPVAQPKK